MIYSTTLGLEKGVRIGKGVGKCRRKDGFSLVRFTAAKRLVIGSDLSFKGVERLCLVQKTIEASAPRDARFRWVDPSNIRAELAFLDWIEPEIIPFIKESLAKMVEPLFPFEMTIQRVYAGPTRKHPRYFYAGLDASAAEVLTLLRRMLQREFASFGLILPTQEYTPCIFLGRGMSNFDSRRALKKVKDLKICNSMIRDLGLFEAVNAPLSARTDDYITPTYRAVQRFILGGRRSV